jgi:hypothetical protein
MVDFESGLEIIFQQSNFDLPTKESRVNQMVKGLSEPNGKSDGNNNRVVHTVSVGGLTR